MSLDRRNLLLTAAAAAGLAGAGPKKKASGAKAASGPPKPVSRADAALKTRLEDLAEQLLIKQPETATNLGLDKDRRAGLKSQLSAAAQGNIESDRIFCRNNLADLAAFPDAELSPSWRLHKAVVAFALELGRDAAPFDFGNNTLNSAMSESASPHVVSQQAGAYTFVPEFLDSQHTVANEDDADAYLDRLHAMAGNIGQETNRIERDAARGVIPPDFIVANVIGQQQDLLKIPAAQARMSTVLERKTREAKVGGDYGARAAMLVEKEVYPALARQLAAFKDLQGRAKHDAGVWRLPEGEAYYSWLLREGTSTALTADEIHRMGLEQAQAIDARMDGLLKAQGMTKGTVGERMAALGADPRYLFPDTDAGRAQIIAYLNGVLAAVRPKLSKAFTLKLKAPVQVKRVPVDIQDGAGQGYMNPGSMDGSRPSIYYINLKTTKNWPKFSLPTLTFHEGVPGHAWQGAYLVETGQMPLIRVILSGFNAYVEGYALYAEQLGDEIGMYDDDWAGRLGYLQGQQFRAVRLVVDTGLHAKRWSREQAIQWAMDHAGRTRNAMTSEIDRYSDTPGQACGYKIGHSEINRLRDRARAKMGAAFDVRRFNDLLVETGAVPLTVLGQTVDIWAASGGRLKI